MVGARRRHEAEATVRCVDMCQRGVDMFNVSSPGIVEIECAVIDIQLLFLETKFAA